MFSVDEVCDVIRAAAQTAKETGDYLSYAAVLDEHLGDPKNFSHEDSIRVLENLLEVLEVNHDIVYKIGWDLPEILIRYIDNYNSTKQAVRESKHVLIVTQICTLLCEHGNSEELFLSSSELILVLARTTTERRGVESFEKDKIARENPKHLDIERINLSSDEIPRGEKERNSVSSSLPSKGPGETRIRMPAPTTGPQASEIAAELDHQVNPVDEEILRKVLKFCVLFEIMQYTLKKIQTPYPSRFLATAALTLLTIMNALNDNLMATSVILRRMFLFARDCNISIANASSSEMKLIQCILRNFLTYAAETALERVSVKWAQRLYYQVVNRVALAPIYARECSFHKSPFTERITDALQRISQLSLSYDLDLKRELRDAFENLNKQQQNSEDYKIDTTIIEKDKSNETIFISPSIPGLILLATQLHYNGRRVVDLNTLNDVGSYSVTLFRSGLSLAGVCDSMLYWALWLTINLDKKRLSACTDEGLDDYLQILFWLAATSTDKHDKHIAYSSAGKLLRLRDQKISFNFLMNCLTECPYENVLDAVVQMLKSLMTGKLKGALENSEDLQKFRELDRFKPFEATHEERLRILAAAETCIDDAISQQLISPLLLSWLNLLTVVSLDDEKVLRLCSRLDDLAQDREVMQHECLRLGLESLRKHRTNK